MSITLANVIRPTGTPIYCSACRSQHSEKRYVDFDAECDRGYGDAANGKPIQMDDLILCDDCIRTAGRFVGMADAEAQVERIASLEERLAAETARCDQMTAYANRMEDALAARPEPISVNRPRGRPRRADGGHRQKREQVSASA